MFRWFRFPKNYYPIFFILLLVGFSVLLANGVLPKKYLSITDNDIIHITDDEAHTKQNSLQLSRAKAYSTMPIPTPTGPLPSGVCKPHHVKQSCECPSWEYEEVKCWDPNKCSLDSLSGLMAIEEEEKCGITDIANNVKNKWIKESDPTGFEANKSKPNCAIFCAGKPVIYLYPEIPTMVDVVLTIPGTIVESDPLYPENGWRNVLAQPDGTLFYEGKQYHELYYESALDAINAPHTGFFLKREMLEEQMRNIIQQLGLIKHEEDEFIEYWLPKLQDLKTPYVFFSVFDKPEKERIDHVTITPKPDTTIEFIAYFKGVILPYNTEPLVLPKNPPQRIGFTAVEWGGIIDYPHSDKL